MTTFGFDSLTCKWSIKLRRDGPDEVLADKYEITPSGDLLFWRSSMSGLILIVGYANGAWSSFTLVESHVS